MGEETKRAETIVEGHDHRPLSGQVLTVVPGHAARTAGETAAVDPDHHGPAVIGVAGAGPHVCIEAVFTARWLPLRGTCGGPGSGRWRGCRRGSTSPAAARRSRCSRDTR